jgi:hypothetical protein
MNVRHRHPHVRITVVSAGFFLTLLAFTGCSSSSTSSTSAAQSVTGSPTASTAAGSAVTACEEWRSIDVNGVPAAISAPMRATAARAATAAGAQASGLATAMQAVSELPNTDLTDAELALAARDGATIKADCASLGVTISN